MKDIDYKKRSYLPLVSEAPSSIEFAPCVSNKNYSLSSGVDILSSFILGFTILSPAMLDEGPAVPYSLEYGQGEKTKLL